MMLEQLEGSYAYQYTINAHKVGTVGHLFIYMQKNEPQPEPNFFNTEIHS